MNFYRVMRSLSKEEVLIKARALFRDVKSMPYYSFHEKAVEGILTANGLKSWNTVIDINTTMVWDWIKTPEIASVMPNMTFMSQPCGSQSSPDFIVKLEEGVLLGLECKSSKTTAYPMYNSGGIKERLIYVYSSHARNATTIYMGEDILSKEQCVVIDELYMKQLELEKEYNGILKSLDVNKRGVSYYTRPMICQTGGSEYTNYFTHPDRERCEKNVLKYVEDMIHVAYT
jgi:hypothetical protein